MYQKNQYPAYFPIKRPPEHWIYQTYLSFESLKMAKIIISLLLALFAVSGGVHGNPIAIFPAEFLECVGSQYLLKPVKETTLEGKFKLRTYTFGDVNRKLGLLITSADEKIWSIFESKYDSATTRDVQIEGGFPNPDHGILKKLAKYVEIVVKTVCNSKYYLWLFHRWPTTDQHLLLLFFIRTPTKWKQISTRWTSAELAISGTKSLAKMLKHSNIQWRSMHNSMMVFYIVLN